jgi:hypothetical protein
MWLKLALVAIVAAGAVGCVHPSVYTTKNTTAPILLGPMRNLGVPQPAPPGPVVNSFVTEIENFFMVSSSQSRQGNVVTTTTTTAWQKEGPAKFDLAMINALQACPSCTARTQRVHVGSYYLFWLFAVMEKNWAGIHATVHGR